MKVLVIFLDYLRHDFTKQSLKSIADAGYPFDLITIDKFGIATATNDGFDFAKKNGYDAIVYAANDIQLPDNWLAQMVHYAQTIPNTGMCGIHCVESLGHQIEMNGLMIHPTNCAFANILIPMKVIDDIGYMNEDHDPYGMQDSDYALRLNNSGYINYYIPNLTQQHIGHDVGNGTEYRKMKDEGLSAVAPKWEFWANYYAQNGYSIQDRNIFKTKNMITGNFNYKNIPIQQHAEIKTPFNELLKSIKPKQILEIGTASGGLTLMLRDTLNELGLNDTIIRSYDVEQKHFLNQHIQQGLEVIIKNVFNSEYTELIELDEINSFINREGATVVLCDGGNKINEFKMLSGLLKLGDVIMAHDYCANEDTFNADFKNKIWNWLEIQDSDIEEAVEKNKLKPFMATDFAKVVWVCKIK